MAVKIDTKTTVSLNKIEYGSPDSLYKLDAGFQTLLKNDFLSFVLIDRNYKIIVFNQQAANVYKEISGLQLIEGDNSKKIVSRKEFSVFVSDFENAIKGKSVSAEHQLIDKKHKLRTFDFNFTPVLNDEGDWKYISFTMLEITELKKTAADLDRSEKLVESVFHTADVGIAIVDEAGKIVKTNDGLTKLFGYDRNEMNSMPWYKIIAHTTDKEIKVAHAEILKGKTITCERKAVLKNGTFRDIYISNQLLKNTDGSKYIIKTVRDVTDSNQYKELLQRTETMAKLGGFEITPGVEKILWTEEMYNIFEVEKDFTPTVTFVYNAYLKRDLQEVKHRIHDALVHGKQFDVVRKIITARHNVKWLHVIGTPIQIKANTYKLIGTVQDVTAQKLAEEQIERLSWVASHTNSSVIITDHHGKIEWVNKSFEKLTGYPLKEVKGKNPGQILQGKGTDKETVRRMSERLSKQEPSQGEVLLNYTKSGVPVWISADITPIFKDGQLINFIGIMTDLTELIKAKEGQEKQGALMQKQQLFNAIATYFPNGIIGVIDQDLRYVFVGGTELKKLGMDHDKLVGDKIFDRIHPEGNDLAEPYLKKTFQNEEVSFEVMISGNTYQVIAVPIKDNGNSITQSLVVINNISEQKRVEEGLKKIIEKQKELNDMKTKFVSIASHEFRTPLSTILSSSSLVEQYNKPEDAPKRQKHLTRIKTSIHNLTDILNDFLILGKMEDGGIKNSPAVFDIRLFFKELIDEMQANLKDGKKIKLAEQTDRDLAFLDAKHFKNVLLNLLSNAIKYSPEDKTIYISYLFYNGNLEVKVRDEGMGIPSEDQVHLFSTFYRANNVTNIQGTGMGLHIVKKYIDLMGGTIGFESELDNGSTFTVELPQASLGKDVTLS